MNRTEKGFTLIELLVVLGIVSTLLVIGGSVHISTIDQYQFNNFYELFQNDILYMQQLNMVKKEKLNLTIDPKKHSYEIKTSGLGKVLVKRDIPTNWNIQLNTLAMPLSYTADGNIIHPGMFSIQTRNKTYYIYFPFGKGRCYLVEKS